MSRTYRKRLEEAFIWENKHNAKYEKQQIAKHFSDKGFKGYAIDKGPRWFKKLYHIRPHRAKEKALEERTKKLINYDDAPEFPLARRPKEYWW